MYGPAFTFLGIPACDLADPSTYKGADVIILGAPIDSGTSHRSEAKFGPHAIRSGDYVGVWLTPSGPPFIATYAVYY